MHKKNTTDGKVDDMNSVIRFLLYSNEMDLSKYIAKKWPDIRIINDQSNFWHFAYAWKIHTKKVNSKLHGEPVSFTVPADAKPGNTIHIITEVQNNGKHMLKHYHCVIATVK